MFHANHRTKALAAMLVLVGVIGFAGIREAKAAREKLDKLMTEEAA